MLKISRKEGEAFTIVLPNGDTVEVELTRYKGDDTIVGIAAPQNIKIWRNELLSSLEQ